MADRSTHRPGGTKEEGTGERVKGARSAVANWEAQEGQQKEDPLYEKTGP